MKLFNLRRITSSGNWIPEIDGLRFIAIASVLVAHILTDTYHRTDKLFPQESLRLLVNKFGNCGSRGVSLFFAISGFILAQPFLRQHLHKGRAVSIRGYFKRRLTRLEPPYILSLLAYTLALALAHAPVSVRGLLAQAVYVHNWTDLPTVNFVTWSLEVEVQFYILAPLLGLLYVIRSRGMRRGIMVGLTLGSMYLVPQSRLSGNLPGQLQFFMVGFLLADIRAMRAESSTSYGWDIAGFISLVEMFILPAGRVAYVLPVLILLLCLSAFNGPIIRQALRIEWIAVTGGMCYSFYLMHMLVISTALRFTGGLADPSSFLLTLLIQFVILGACVYVVCTAYYVFIERPCMDPKWPRKLRARFSGKTEKAPERRPSGETLDQCIALGEK
jgi:peptidoglycan/LPS O-acetylase OafA/YrhL